MLTNSLFGNPNQAQQPNSTSLFGNQQQGGGLFGKPNNNPPQGQTWSSMGGKKFLLII